MAFPSYTYTFSNGTTADASQVSQNFTDILNGVSDTTKDLSISALTAGGAATLNGNVTLGNGSAKTLTVNASLSSSIPIGTNTTYDLGSATLGIRTVYIGGTSTFTTALTSAATASYTLNLPTGAGTTGQALLYGSPLTWGNMVKSEGWSGYHSSDASWARTSAAFGDTAVDTTVTFTERFNNGFGTVTSYKSGADFLPGIVFTPTSSGAFYLIIAVVQSFGPATANVGQGLRLFNVTDSVELCATGWQTNGTAQDVQSNSLMGIFSVASVAARTIAVQSRSASGTITLTSVTSGVNTVEWTIVRIS